MSSVTLLLLGILISYEKLLKARMVRRLPPGTDVIPPTPLFGGLSLIGGVLLWPVDIGYWRWVAVVLAIVADWSIWPIFWWPILIPLEVLYDKYGWMPPKWTRLPRYGDWRARARDCRRGL